MAKLSRMEITAISQQIQEELRKEKKASNDSKNLELSESFYATETGQKVKFLLHNEATKNFINTSFVNKFIGITYYYGVSIDAIERKLIIEQIECENVKELIEKVTESFKTEI
jgi:hypothetical protein